ncbi:nucleoporin NUP42-like [Battus philenor]|uniref:nucleoporin NUP42-like n=1 Tax=Battus philenor TaxID=42288 RepID=UPI0035D072C6
MVVCKFFQQGYCRYGQNCRFEHVYGSKYSYHAPTTQTQPAQTTNVVTDEQLVNQVQCDIQAALKGGQWIISSYAPFKEKPIYPGLSDLSPEEARLLIYEAKANNNLEQAVAYMDNLFLESRRKYEQLLQPTVNTINILRSLYKGENAMQASSQTLNANNNASSIFRSAVNNTNTSVFNQNANTSIFGQSPDNGAAKSIFAQANQATFGQPNPVMFPNSSEPKSLFAQENQKIFGQTPVNAASIFANASQNIFSKSEAFAQSNSTFPSQPSENIFQRPDVPSNVFQKTEPQSIFGAANNIFEQEKSVNDNFYSNIEDLTPADLEAYKSNEFKLGSIPEVPPPQSLCV